MPRPRSIGCANLTLGRAGDSCQRRHCGWPTPRLGVHIQTPTSDRRQEVRADAVLLRPVGWPTCRCSRTLS
jgi:hypothetical protein